MRLFIGIPLPDQYQRLLASIAREWNDRFKSRLSWTKQGNWHVTLKFLGDVEEGRVPDLKKFMEELHFERFSLEGAKAGFFGSKGVYRVIWLGLKNDVKSLVNLAGKIDHGLAAKGYAKEKRPFTGHLTLARIKNFYRNDPWNEMVNNVGSLAWPCFEVKEAVLWQSFLSPSGPKYEVVGRAELS